MLVLDPIFGDHMVLQQQSVVTVWGSAAAFSQILVSFRDFFCRIESDSTGGWSAEIPPLIAGGPDILEIRSGLEALAIHDVWVGDVWLCSGASNMDQRMATGAFYWCGVENQEEEIAAATFPLIRMYSVKLQFAEKPCRAVATTVNDFLDANTPGYSGMWQICSPQTAGSFSACAYYMAQQLFLATGVAQGVITTCYGASTAEAWISSGSVSASEDLAPLLDAYSVRCQQYKSGELGRIYQKQMASWRAAQSGKGAPFGTTSPLVHRHPRRPKAPPLDQHSPSVLYNGMIAPLGRYRVSGAVWYHGGSNKHNAHLYYQLLRTLVRDWRYLWGEELPFVIIQCANVRQPQTEVVEDGPIPIIREAQMFASRSLIGVRLVVAVDIGEAATHPRNKKELGKRVALEIRSFVLNQNVSAGVPLFREMQRESSRIRLFFDNASGLYLRPGETSFAISNRFGTFSQADAIVDRETVIVQSLHVSCPRHVRYAWAANPRANLYNAAELPASPFRTDLAQQSAPGEG
jgi:sialate O-acetylesterase